MWFSRIKSNALFVSCVMEGNFHPWHVAVQKPAFFFSFWRFEIVSCAHDTLPSPWHVGWKTQQNIVFLKAHGKRWSQNSSNVYSWRRLSMKAKQGIFSPSRFFRAIPKHCFVLKSVCGLIRWHVSSSFIAGKVAELFQFLFLASGVQWWSSWFNWLKEVR